LCRAIKTNRSVFYFMIGHNTFSRPVSNRQSHGAFSVGCSQCHIIGQRLSTVEKLPHVVRRLRYHRNHLVDWIVPYTGGDRTVIRKSPPIRYQYTSVQRTSPAIQKAI